MQTSAEVCRNGYFYKCSYNCIIFKFEHYDAKLYIHDNTEIINFKFLFKKINEKL